MADQSSPDYRLSFEEGFYQEEPRRCWRIKRFSVSGQNDFLLVRVEPLIERAKYGLPDSDESHLVLAPRWQGTSLFYATEWPMRVNVLYPLVPRPQDLDSLEVDATSFIAIGEIVPIDWLNHLDRFKSGPKGGAIRTLPQPKP